MQIFLSIIIRRDAHRGELGTPLKGKHQKIQKPWFHMGLNAGHRKFDGCWLVKWWAAASLVHAFISHDLPSDILLVIQLRRNCIPTHTARDPRHSFVDLRHSCGFFQRGALDASSVGK